ncbi:hypothetical protein [Actinacidiphila acididurans]|uniref:Uncharacterized protein n=1 Tax=Actinacidiphila acididurans TaxID=2784346 RepID=A0ABS2U2D0_9ACTN|nr:hypothetical protein [Actinacidiphila acididurans]MBM9509764.1 hypothetical protein [Actinacidiphila acididurans]
MRGAGRGSGAYALYVLACAAWLDGQPGRARRLAEESLACDHAFHDLAGAVLTFDAAVHRALHPRPSPDGRPGIGAAVGEVGPLRGQRA